METQKYCPGSRKLREPQPEYVQCPHCSSEVEIWSDESKAKCPNCQNVLTRDLGPSCIDWCKSAEECFGDELHKHLKTKSGEAKT